ncbi:hypothetical protein D039_1434A, partial [Vibrio parahaemolyticus EKP-028]
MKTLFFGFHLVVDGEQVLFTTYDACIQTNILQSAFDFTVNTLNHLFAITASRSHDFFEYAITV